MVYKNGLGTDWWKYILIIYFKERGDGGLNNTYSLLGKASFRE